MTLPVPGSGDPPVEENVDGIDLTEAIVEFDAAVDGAHLFEIAGLIEPGMTRFGTFGVGQLIVGENESVTLVDDYSNQDSGREALYLWGLDPPSSGEVNSLIIRSGGTLRLQGIDAFAYDFTSQSMVHLNSLFGEGVTSVPWGDGWIEMPSRRGDFNADGDVDGLDFLAWQRGLGTTGALAGDGDADGDHDVDADDLNVWVDHFGQPPILAAVPEPPAAVAAMLAAAAMAFSLRQSHREIKAVLSKE
jgi:hypothetical protein